MQFVAGGLVYFSTFRRPLMSVLNLVWRFIQSFKVTNRRNLPLTSGVQSELILFLGLLPFAHIAFRFEVSGTVTASDASFLGGGVCATSGVTTLGEAVCSHLSRRERPDEIPDEGVVCIGLFNGISAAQVALEAIRAQVLLQVSIDSSPTCRRVVESNFPGVVFLEQVEEVTATIVHQLACKVFSARLVLVTAGLFLCVARSTETNTQRRRSLLLSGSFVTFPTVQLFINYHPQVLLTLFAYTEVLLSRRA